MNQGVTDPLIERLAGGLEPARRLNPAALWLGAGAGLCAAVAYVLTLYGFRSEIRAGILPVMAIVKPLIFLVIAAGALSATAALSRPEGRLDWRQVAPIAAAVVLVVAAIVLEIAVAGWRSLSDGLNGGMRMCYITILCGGVAGFILLWRLWLRRAATSHPRLMGAMAGLAAASLTAAAYTLYCDMDAPIYILLVYGLPVAAISLLAAFAGGKLLRW